MNGEESELANNPPDPGMIASATGMRARDPWEMNDSWGRRALPKMPIKCGFNPAQSPLSQAMWVRTSGRILALLWRLLHLCSDRWWEDGLLIADRIEMRRPKTAAELFTCFIPEVDKYPNADFASADTMEFCAAALDYFTGAKGVSYTIGGSTLMVQMDRDMDKPPTSAECVK